MAGWLPSEKDDLARQWRGSGRGPFQLRGACPNCDHPDAVSAVWPIDEVLAPDLRLFKPVDGDVAPPPSPEGPVVACRCGHADHPSGCGRRGSIPAPGAGEA